MKTSFVLTGTVLDNPDNILPSLMQTHFPNTYVKTRIFGTDINYKEDDLELFLNSIDDKDYHLQVDSPRQEIIEEICDRLANLFEQNKILYNMGWYEKDENGNQLTEDMDRIHPDWKDGLLT